MFTKFIAHIRMRAQQENAGNVLAWAVKRFLARVGNDLFIFFWHAFLGWLPSLPGRWVRRVVLKVLLAECGQGLQVGENVHIEYPRRISLGDNVWIGRGCHIEGMGGIHVGDYTLIALQSLLQTAGHEIIPGELYLHSKLVFAPIIIGRNVWLGARTCVKYGIEIGDNSITAMGSVVSKSIPPNIIVGGVPAKMIRKIDERFTNSDNNENQIFLER